MILVSEKNKEAVTYYCGGMESRSFASIQVDGDLGSDEIEFLLVGIDIDDPLTGRNGTANQPMLDDNGQAIKITASTANPLGIFRPGRFLIKKPATTNDVGIMLFENTAK